MNKVIIGALAGIVVVAIISAGSIYLYTQFQNTNKQKANPTTQETKIDTPQPNPTTLFSGKLTKLDKDLGIIKLSETAELNFVTPPIYYSAGTFLYGPYKDFTRIVIVRQPEGPGGPTIDILATKDFVTYILDGNKTDTELFALGRYYNPLSGLDTTKVTEVAELDTEHSKSINLDKNYGLFRGDPVSISENVAQSNNWLNVLLTKTDDFEKLEIQKPNLNFYAAKIQTQHKNGEFGKYIKGDTNFYVQDETGLIYGYTLAFNSQILSYDTKFKTYKEALAAYEKNSVKNPNLKYPDAVETPRLSLKSTDINTKEPLYDKYSVAFPAACGFDSATKVLQNVSDTDLTSIGKVGDLTVFKLKDTQHALLKQEFETKAGYDATYFKDIFSKKPPTYDEYNSKASLLIIKDALGRFVALGEFDYLLPGGCGKPVVYLYPEKPTQISIKLNNQISFTRTVPEYQPNFGWTVLANPNGKLKNLKSENCQNIKSGFGTEYAQKACEQNEYSYLYWSGTNLENNYVKPSQGWNVKSENLNKFLTEKLAYMGLNSKEIYDFTEYWVPTMQNKNAKLYRVSFLQNNELNLLNPMTVNPKPESTIRVFMDWEPLKVEQNINPQNLLKYQRKGYTLVEWGGLRF